MEDLVSARTLLVEPVETGASLVEPVETPAEHTPFMRRLTSDDGFTIVELATAMALFAGLVLIFLAALVGLTSTVNNVSASAHGASTNQLIISALSRQLPYADAINRPVAVSGSRYIEWRLPASATADNLVACVQWRYTPSSGLIETRRWSLTAVGSTVVNLTAWSTKGTDVIDQGGVGFPFTMIPADAHVQRQQLRISLATGNEIGDDTTSKTALTARNSSSTSLTNTDANIDGVSDQQVCQQAGRS